MEYCGYTSCLRIPVDKEEKIELKNKRITMVQLENYLRNSSFVRKSDAISYFSVIFRALHLNLAAGWLAGSE